MKTVLVALALALLLMSCGTAQTSDRVLPDVQLELLNGGTYNLNQTGTPRALNLWATWCAPCRAELPDFDDVASRVNGVEVIGVNTGESQADAVALVEELGLNFTQVLDEKAALQTHLRITGMPATIFVDAQGAVVDIHSGELDREELETKLRDLFDAQFLGE